MNMHCWSIDINWPGRLDEMTESLTVFDGSFNKHFARPDTFLKKFIYR